MVVPYFTKLRGQGGRSLPRAPFKRSVETFVISFIGMLALSLIHFQGMTSLTAVEEGGGAAVDEDPRFAKEDWIMLIGSQAATAVLVFNAIESPLAQPRNVIFGNMLSAFWGVAFSKSIPSTHTYIVRVRAAVCC